MRTRTSDFIRLLGSTWVFRITLLIFAAEAGWLAVTSRFPMAFDEAYHFGFIRYFSHHLNPIITSQSPDTYRFGAIIQDPSFLYHYLMSFVYRAVTLFTASPQTQVICLRLVNVALALATLLVIRKLLGLINISGALANLLVFAFALTPLVTVLAAQINYDNLLILAVSGSVYTCLIFLRHLDKGRFDTKSLLALVALCLFSSLVKVAFLPVLAAIAAVVLWKVICRWRRSPKRLAAQARKSFRDIGPYTKLALLTAITIGSLLFARFYLLNLVRYHDPAPQCDKVLSVQDCSHYYAWNNGHSISQYNREHDTGVSINILQYSGYWFIVNTFELFGVLIPLEGRLFLATPYALLVGLVGTVMAVCAAWNFKAMVRRNPALLTLGIISLTYLSILWLRNYREYSRVGEPVFIHGRYVLPVLIYVYVLLAAGFQHALEKSRGTHLTAIRASKAVLASVVILAFLYYGGSRQYTSSVEPVYGRLGPSNHYTFDNAAN